MSSLVFLELLLLFLVLFLLLLVISIGFGIIIIYTLVVVVYALVVVIHFLVIAANDLVVLFCTHTLGIGSIGSIRQFQFGIGQLAAGELFVVFGCFVVFLPDLLIVLDSLIVLGNGFVVGLLDSLVGLSGFDHSIDSVVFGIGIGAIVNGRKCGLFQFCSLCLGGQCHGHCHCNSEGAAGLGQILRVILLFKSLSCHNFNLLLFH